MTIKFAIWIFRKIQQLMYMLWFTLKYISYVDNISDYILPYENEGRINS